MDKIRVFFARIKSSFDTAAAALSEGWGGLPDTQQSLIFGVGCGFVLGVFVCLLF